MNEPKPRVVIAGTGKLAVNIGIFLYKFGWTVHWLTRTADRLETANLEISRKVRRIAASCGEGGSLPQWSLSLLDEYVGPADLIIESSVEDLVEKQAIAATLATIGHPNTVRLTNSSSVLPSSLGKDWLGCHFFYPLELSGFVELIIPTTCSHQVQDSALRLIKAWNFHAIIQTEDQAFAVNRLLVPLQAEAISCLMSGYPASLVEQASVTDLFPVGMLSTMDSIGLDLVLAAVRNYVQRDRHSNHDQVSRLIEGLATLTAGGKHGAVNANGLLQGDPLPWVELPPGSNLPALKAGFQSIARKTCRDMVVRGEISRDDLCLVIRQFWGSSLTPGELLGIVEESEVAP